MKKTALILALLLSSITINAQNYPDMVYVEGGSFTMGCTYEQDDCGGDEKPSHEVRLSDFYIAKTEITVAQYKAFCEQVGYTMPKAPSWGWNDNDPMVNVTWEDANFYCEWLTEVTGKTYSLPTEAQWEFAARGGTKSKNYKYAGGNSLLFVGWFDKSSGGKAHTVASKKPNELGLYDMSGNVWEWCLDWYDSDYYSNSPSYNPEGSSSGSLKVLRGGSWRHKATYCRVANRFSYLPDDRNDINGFRVVLR